MISVIGFFEGLFKKCRVLARCERGHHKFLGIKAHMGFYESHGKMAFCTDCGKRGSYFKNCSGPCHSDVPLVRSFYLDKLAVRWGIVGPQQP